MPDLFSPFTTPSPPARLKARVVAMATSSQRTPGILRLLDTLGASRSWWLAWGASVLMLAVLAGGPRAGGQQEEFTAESWQRYRASIVAALGTDDAGGVVPRPSVDRPSTPEGAT